jgi:hypothetical protein
MKHAIPYLIIGALALLFCAFSLLTLSKGHIHEDGYILFQYVKNLSAGRGIVFDHVSGHAEGATDFLWMATLAGCAHLGLDPAVIATLLNALGLGTIMWVLVRLRGGFDSVTTVGMLLVGVSGGTVAALAGFSTLAFGGLFSLVILTAMQRQYRALALLALLLGLCRPEGVLLGGGTIVALLLTGERDERRHLARALMVPAMIGVGYFLWRCSYFGLLLPLPLLVKSSRTHLAESLGFNLAAIELYIPLLLPIIAARMRGVKQALGGRGMLIMTLGPIALFVSLLFSHQTQNVEFRFQYPIVVSLVAIFVASARGAFQSPIIACALAALPVLTGYRAIAQGYLIQTTPYYINSFPQLLRAGGFTVEKIALTEAGRLPYWYDAPMMIDLIGLNSPATVLHGPAAALERSMPELILVHHAGTFRAPKDAESRDILEVDPHEIVAISPDQVSIREEAPLAALKFAQSHDYRTLFVRYGADDDSLSHVYFVSPSLNFDFFLAILRQSFREHMNYFASASQVQ